MVEPRKVICTTTTTQKEDISVMNYSLSGTIISPRKISHIDGKGLRARNWKDGNTFQQLAVDAVVVVPSAALNPKP